MAHVEFTVVGDPAMAKQTVVNALEARGFTLVWTDDWTAIAEKGSKVANVFLGAFAQYFKVGLAVRSADPSNSVIVLDAQSSGYLGGLWGASKTKANLRELRDELGATFEAAGVLIGTSGED